MTFVIAVVNPKGGCGKSTIAVNLAAGLQKAGLKTALADMDRQKSALGWARLRAERIDGLAVLDWTKEVGKVPKSVQRLVVDCPASIRGKGVREVIDEADALVVPLLPSAFDLDATVKFLGKLNDAKAVRKGKKPVCVVLNRHRQRSVEATDAREKLLEAGVDHVATVSDRSAFPRLAAQGGSVFDHGSRDMRDLQAELVSIVSALDGTGR